MAQPEAVAQALNEAQLEGAVWLKQSTEGAVAVPAKVACASPVLAAEVAKDKGRSEADAIPLPRQVTADVLRHVVQYLEFHQVPGRSDKERRQYDARLASLATRGLCELTAGADALQLRSVVDLASRALARKIEGKSPEQIRTAFGLPDDLSPEEKLQPLQGCGSDPRARLLNRLYARKRQQLRSAMDNAACTAAAAAAAWPDEPGEQPVQQLAGLASGAADASTAGPQPPQQPPQQQPQQQRAASSDERSVDELLAFIEAGGGEQPVQQLAGLASGAADASTAGPQPPQQPPPLPPQQQPQQQRAASSDERSVDELLAFIEAGGGERAECGGAAEGCGTHKKARRSRRAGKGCSKHRGSSKEAAARDAEADAGGERSGRSSSAGSKGGGDCAPLGAAAAGAQQPDVCGGRGGQPDQAQQQQPLAAASQPPAAAARTCSDAGAGSCVGGADCVAGIAAALFADLSVEELFPEEGFDDEDDEEVRQFEAALGQDWHVRMVELLFESSTEAAAAAGAGVGDSTDAAAPAEPGAGAEAAAAAAARAFTEAHVDARPAPCEASASGTAAAQQQSPGRPCLHQAGDAGGMVSGSTGALLQPGAQQDLRHSAGAGDSSSPQLGLLLGLRALDSGQMSGALAGVPADGAADACGSAGAGAAAAPMPAPVQPQPQGQQPEGQQAGVSAAVTALRAFLAATGLDRHVELCAAETPPGDAVRGAAAAACAGGGDGGVSNACVDVTLPSGQALSLCCSGPAGL